MTTITIDQLINDVIIRKCIKLYTADDLFLSIDDVHLSLSGAVEKCLRYFCEDQNIQFDEKDNLNKLLYLAEKKTKFPKKFIGYCQKFRSVGNSERHDITNIITAHDLFIIRLEFYQFINWFVNNYLKQTHIEILEFWYNEVYLKVPIEKNRLINNNLELPIKLKRIDVEIGLCKQRIEDLIKEATHEKNRNDINRFLFLEWKVRLYQLDLVEWCRIKTKFLESNEYKLLSQTPENNLNLSSNQNIKDFKLSNEQQEIWDQAVQARKEYEAIHEKRKTINGTPEELDAYVEAHYNAWLKAHLLARKASGEDVEPFKPVSREEALRIVRAGFQKKG